MLWTALVLNALMFVVELAASWASRSVALLAASIDFFGDAGNCAISLTVPGLATPVRSKAALIKAACMGAFGVFVLGKALRNLQTCTRNDVLGNVAVMLAALGVFGTGRPLPDLAVAGAMALLSLTGSWTVMRQARAELRLAVLR